MSRGFLKGVLILCVLMLLVLAASLPFIERGTATYVVLQLGVIHILVAMAIVGVILHFDLDPFRAFR